MKKPVLPRDVIGDLLRDKRLLNFVDARISTESEARILRIMHIHQRESEEKSRKDIDSHTKKYNAEIQKLYDSLLELSQELEKTKKDLKTLSGNMVKLRNRVNLLNRKPKPTEKPKKSWLSRILRLRVNKCLDYLVLSIFVVSIFICKVL